MSPVNTEWFKRRIVERELSQRRIGDKLGLDGAAINHMIHGRRNVSASEATKLAEILGAPISEIFQHFGIEVNSLGTTATIIATINDDGLLKTKPINKRRLTPLPWEMPVGTVAARNEDPSSMRYGWTYYFVQATALAPEAVGRLAICTLADDRMVCGFLRAGFKSGTYNIVCDGETVENAHLKGATPVLWIKAG